MCDFSLWQLTAPSLDLQEVQALGGREATQDPKEIRVLLKEHTSYSGTSTTSRLSVLCCLQVIRDSQGYQDYQGRTLFKFHTECRRGMQVSHVSSNSFVNLQHLKSKCTAQLFPPFHQLQELKRVDVQRSIAVTPAVAKGQSCSSILSDIYCFLGSAVDNISSAKFSFFLPFLGKSG